MLKPVIAHIRLNGLKIVIFLDDIFVASSVKECLSQLSLLRTLLEDLGFVVNDDKSQLVPSPRRFLGFIIDSVTMKRFLPDEKVQKIILTCSNLVSEQTPTVKTGSPCHGSPGFSISCNKLSKTLLQVY